MFINATIQIKWLAKYRDKVVWTEWHVLHGI